MSNTRATPYTVETCPPYGSVNLSILTACRIATKYASRVPTWQELSESFGMSRATAYRWRAAMLEARGQR